MTKKEMIKRLNEDLAGEFGAIIQYLTYAAKATGPFRPQLAQFFMTEVADEQLHAQFLANKIVALGGEPTTQPRAVPAAATNHEMLEAVLAAEQRAAKDYTQRALDAEALGDKGWMVQLEDMVRDESGHSEETERILRDWPVITEPKTIDRILNHLRRTQASRRRQRAPPRCWKSAATTAPA